MFRLPAAFVRLAILVVATSPAQGATLFWTEYRYDPDDPDAIHGEVFSLHRADTSDVQGTQSEVVHSLGFQPEYNSLAADRGKVYLRRYFSNEIYSVNFDGTEFGFDAAPSNQVGAELYGRLLDTAGVVSYIPDAEAGKIFRGDFEFENQIELVSTPSFLPNMALVLDEVQGKIYWAGGCNGCSLTLGRANLDGSGQETLPVGDIYYDDYPADLALDLVADKIYWLNESDHKIQRANLDGSGLEDVLDGMLPFSLTVVSVPEPVTWEMMAFSLAAIAAQSARRRSPVGIGARPLRDG